MPFIESLKLVKRWKRKGALFKLGPIDLSLEGGDIFLISGGNGSGKSTLLACLAHLIRPDEGEVRWNDNIRDDDVLFMNQNYHQLCLPWFTCRKNLMLTKAAITSGGSALNEDMNLPPLLRDKLDNPIYVMSGGEKQAMVLTRILSAQKRVVLLDEPFSNLDSVTADFYLNILRRDCKKKKYLCVIVAHNPPETFDKSQVLILNNGKVCGPNLL